MASASGRPDASYLRMPAAALRAALDASRASRLSVSERCCSSSCCACQVKANHNRHAMHLHLQLHLAVTIRPRRPPPFQPPPFPHPFSLLPSPILSASSLPPSCQPPACILPAPSTPSPHPPHLPEHPFEREWRWPWQRGAGRRGRVVLQPRGRPSPGGRGEQGGERRRVPGCRAQQLGQRPIEQHAHECGLRFALAIGSS